MNTQKKLPKYILMPCGIGMDGLQMQYIALPILTPINVKLLPFSKSTPLYSPGFTPNANNRVLKADRQTRTKVDNE